MEYLIRKVERNELDTLVNLCRNHADYEQASYETRGKKELLEQTIFSDVPKVHCYVIEIGGQLKGYFSYTFDFSTWLGQTFLYLDCLYLEPEVRGLRIGESVFEKLKEIARQNNCSCIEWQTPVFNERAIKFYRRMGGVYKHKARFCLGV